MEFIPFLDCPNLQTINLSYNKISNVKSLNKINLKKLSEFIINDNPLHNPI